VPRLELADLGDPRYGDFEGGTLAAYRAWAHDAPSDEAPAGGGESRRSLAARYAAAFRAVLARPEETVLVVCHALPVAYALAAREGEPPEAVVRRAVAHAEPFPFTAAELAAAASVLEAWVAAPTW
jgi:broad specificity phosphatase PhoE